MEPPHKPEALRRISRRHAPLLGPKQAREDRQPAGRERALDVAGRGRPAAAPGCWRTPSRRVRPPAPADGPGRPRGRIGRRYGSAWRSRWRYGRRRDRCQCPPRSASRCALRRWPAPRCHSPRPAPARSDGVSEARRRPEGSRQWCRGDRSRRPPRPRCEG
jgi:hypothetical protein